MGKCDRRFKTSKHRASDKACLEYSTIQKSETEIWNGYHGQITAPKGIFKKIWEDAESEK